tara:strand:- start:156 stop:524 length:369 start_codon:yes stop_codon:yes gene_type:complete
MNDNMKIVIKALRSGEYEQTKETLQDEKGYCCLGVMCAVFEKETGRPLARSRASTLLSPSDIAHIEGESLDAQEGVQRWVGLSDSAGMSTGNNSLVRLNDDKGYTFSEIADFIESEPEGLLV